MKCCSPVSEDSYRCSNYAPMLITGVSRGYCHIVAVSNKLEMHFRSVWMTASQKTQRRLVVSG